MNTKRDWVGIVVSRKLWLGVTYLVFTLITAFLIFLGVGGFEMRSDWFRYALVLPLSLLVGLVFSVLFRCSIYKEHMLGVAYALYIMPLSLLVMVIGYKINNSPVFILSIFGFCFIWPLVRWFHDSIPE